MGALDNRELAYERMIQLWRIHVSRPTKDILAQGFNQSSDGFSDNQQTTQNPADQAVNGSTIKQDKFF